MYMRSSRFGTLPGGRKWMALDLALGDELDTSVPADVDAKGELAVLESVSDDVQRLGEEDVRGVPTTHYRGTISVSDGVKRLREEGAEAPRFAHRKGRFAPAGRGMDRRRWADPGG